MRLTVGLCALFLIMLGLKSATAQYKLEPAFEIDTPAVFVTTDNLDNIYVVTHKNQVLKYNPSGKLLWNYSNRAFGKLAYINATDPMRILLFYPAIQQAIVLNNNLNEITRFNFAQDASQLITLIATANSNGYWIYDQLNQQLRKLTNQFGNELQSANLYQQTSRPLQPAAILASDQYVFLYDAKLGVLQFDQFGNYLTTIKTGAFTSFQIRGKNLLFSRDKQWHCYKTDSSESQTLYTFGEEVLQVSEGNKLLAVLTKKGVKVYRILNNEDEKK